MNDVTITNTSLDDWAMMTGLFKKAMELHGKNGYKVWAEIDEASLKRDIENHLQYKIMRNGHVLCIFTAQYSDPFIWQEKDKGDALYLHRAVVNPDFKGQKQFEKILNWATQRALQNHLKYVRMDTWADNTKIIDYYKSFGFKWIGNHKIGDEPGLPIQNRNLEVALLEMDLSNT